MGNPPPPRTNRTSLVPPLVLIGHAAFQALRGPFGDARGVRLLEAGNGSLSESAQAEQLNPYLAMLGGAHVPTQRALRARRRLRLRVWARNCRNE